MALRPTLQLAFENERVLALARAAAGAGRSEAHVSSSLAPYVSAALAELPEGLGGRPLLFVTPDDRSARDLAADMAAFMEPRRVRYYPSRGTGYASHIAPPPHLAGLRIAALDSLKAGGDAVVVASAVALAEAVPDEELRPKGFSLSVGEEVELTDVAELLAECGYERVEQVEDRGQFAVRGGLLDVFPATEERAIRIELFGDEIESARWFSTFTQRSLGEAERVEFSPAAELSLEHRASLEAPGAPGVGDEDAPGIDVLLPVDRFQSVLDLVPPDTAVVRVGAEDIERALADHWEDATIAMHDADARHLYVDVAGPLTERSTLDLTAVDAGQELELRAQRAESPARTLKEAEGELDRLVRSGYRVVVSFESAGEAERTRYQVDRFDPPIWNGVGELGPVSFAVSRLREGFMAPELKLAVIPFRRLVHRRRASEAPAVRGRRIEAFSDLRVGDFVVHADHGIARFAGFETKTLAGVTRDYLLLEYRGDDRVYAPTEQLAKISRYVGADGHEPALSKLGGKAWEAMKARARRAAKEMAGDLLNLYAERRTRPGHAFPPDGPEQLDFEAAFPFRETADQIEAIEAVKADMEAPTPMDRLVCGDVGYGKTEVALRAIHKAAMDGKQVMVLVPTTILAQQHFGTFRERLADTPINVEVVSRFRRPADVKRVLAEFVEGRVDVLIGTHRLLSRDVRAKDLGLLVIDEEQRFGVRQKELLRQLRLKVDVLSLSATPIPRTLQMSLSGMRDISVIETPPEGRKPVRTYVGPFDEDLVKHSIERERERGGQVFYLHNRIETLPGTAERIRALAPGAGVIEAHGQMDEADLELTMLNFLRGDGDVLVATTIIESGLDIPNANTLIVERADQLGLAQAYQIRGRVGRSRTRAFAYLLYPSDANLTEQARARLATLSDYTELGSGFKIAMRDLDIRGAGDLLGEEQSGHVAAVGFELYCQMIDEAVEALRGAEEPRGEPAEQVRFDVAVDAYIPADYVPYEVAKIDLHRRIVGAPEPARLRELEAELADRFGPVPEPVANLLAMQRARIDLSRAGAQRVEFRGGRLSIAPVELDSTRAKELRERVEGALYEWREQTVGLRVPDDPAARLGATTTLARALAELRESEVADEPAEPAAASL